MAQVAIEYYVHTAWWLPIYLQGMAFTAILMRAEPDWSKVERVVARAITIRFR